MANALEIRNLSKVYKDFSLDSVSFTLPKGCIMGFVGQNGAGKTTTIRLILNMTTRTGGEIKIFDSDNIKDELTVKQELAVVFDEIFFVDVWRVHEVEKAVKGFYNQWDSGLFNGYLNKFKLSSNKKVKELSRGMKLKLMLAVAMSHNAKLLILDEPTSGLDPVARDELLGILREYISDGEKSVFFSTHITSDLEKIADYITLIDNGKVLFTGAKDELAGFSGLLPSLKSNTLTESVVAKTPTIDEILVRISKGDHQNE